MWQKALRAVDGGVVLKIEVSPGSSMDAWDQYDQWRETIRVKVKAKPRGGKANDALISMIAETFDVARGNVRLLIGGKARVKQFMVIAIDVETACARLAEALGQ